MGTAAVRRIFGFGLVVLAFIVGIPAVDAGTVSINSGDAAPNAWNSVGGVGVSNVAIEASPAWAAAGMGYEWISYDASTGCNEFNAITGMCAQTGPTAVVGDITTEGGTSTPATPTAIFYETFTLPYDTNTGSIQVWADDTARVYLIGPDGSNMLIDANPNLGSNCAGGPIGCIPGMDATFNFADINMGAGDYEIEIDAYQLVGSSPFGVMYTGTIDSESSVPEPASYVLMGLGLAALGILVPRTRRA